ncbi:thioester reductase domain-containing protein [Chondromyces crocatus]|uniref:Nonribosomal peptide synthase n=1 Tax=Chondromyces crocatus TaxID=52 RepID=A0A0K1EHS9_CHOCO|nr:thioester reductase domain-containing protein [Chondromyces crocatus]AKT40133.1 nonribosomal peptide synthase [Chondromyces crocatus]
MRLGSGLGCVESLEDRDAGLEEERATATLGALFEAQAARTPDAVAVELEGQTITYRELRHRATCLADELRRLEVGPGVPVALLADRSIAEIIGIVGILVAGGVHVPLDPSEPEERLRHMVDQVEAKVLLSTSGHPMPSYFEGYHGVVDPGYLAEFSRHGIPPDDDPTTAASVFVPGHIDNPACVMFSPGAAGSPRGVAVSHRAILRLVSEARASGLGRHDRVMLASPPHHDAFLLERWGALLQGARLVVMPQETLLSATAFRDAVRAAAISVMFLSTARFHALSAQAPEAFDEVTLLVINGAPLAPPAAQAVLRRGAPKRLLNGYGPAATMLSTACSLLGSPSGPRDLPRVEPLFDRRAYVLDEDLQVAPAGIPGELYLTGDGPGLASVREPSLTARCFSPDPFSTRPGGRMYRTGDHARSLPDGTIELLGRSSSSSEPPGQERAPGRGTRGGDIDALSSSAPSHHRWKPRGIEGESELPRTRTEQRLARLWRELLGVEPVFRQDAFFTLGGDATMAARLWLRIRKEFGTTLPCESIYTSPTLEHLARRVDDEQRSPRKVPSMTGGLLTHHARLDPHIRPVPGVRPPAAMAKCIFLTGATGYLGAFLLRDLVKNTDAEIHCLIRATDAAHGLHLIEEALDEHDLWSPSYRSRIVPVPGSLSGFRLGLDAEQLDELSWKIDAIYHCGAEGDHLEPYFLQRARIVGGTQELLRLSCTSKLKPFHHVSTHSVFGPVGYFKGLSLLREGDDLDLGAPILSVGTGSQQSQWVAEKLIVAARQRGLPVSVYRPGSILGDASRGVAHPNAFVFRLLGGCIEAGCVPDLPRMRQLFVSVDQVSAAITAISRDPSGWGGVYHLVPPARKSVDLLQFFELAAEMGHPLERLPYAEWLERVTRLIEPLPAHPLLPFLPMLIEQVHDGRSRLQLWEGTPAHDDTNTRTALASSGLPCPPLELADVRTYLAQLVRSGSLPPAQPRRVLGGRSETSTSEDTAPPGRGRVATLTPA